MLNKGGIHFWCWVTFEPSPTSAVQHGACYYTQIPAEDDQYSSVIQSWNIIPCGVSSDDRCSAQTSRKPQTRDDLNKATLNRSLQRNIFSEALHSWRFPQVHFKKMHNRPLKFETCDFSRANNNIPTDKRDTGRQLNVVRNTFFFCSFGDLELENAST